MMLLARNVNGVRVLNRVRALTVAASAVGEVENGESSSSPAAENGGGNSSGENGGDSIGIKVKDRMAEASVTMPVSSMTGSIVGKKFYKKVSVREGEDGVGWRVMLDYRTLKTPCKRPLKLPSLAFAMAVAAEWEYQETDGIRPFTMPLMKLACTALERVPLTRTKIIETLMSRFHQDLVFSRSPGECDISRLVLEKQVERMDPFLEWVEAEFGVKPVVHSGLLGGKQDDALVKTVTRLLQQTTDFELAGIDAIASATSHSLMIALGLFLHNLSVDDALHLARLEEDFQVGRWGLVEGGHDVDVAHLRVQISSASLFLLLSKIN